jgi:hypothetical protein
MWLDCFDVFSFGGNVFRVKLTIMKLNAVRGMLITSLIIILLYILGLFLPIIKNTKESKLNNFNKIDIIV